MWCNEVILTLHNHKNSFIVNACIKPNLYLNANRTQTRTRHAKPKRMFDVDVLPRRGKQHSAVQWMFGKQPNAIRRLLMRSIDKISYQYFFDIFNFCLFYLQVGLADCSCSYDVSTKIVNRNERKYETKLIDGTDCKTDFSLMFSNGFFSF